MKSIIYYFSGTGNSLSVARGLAEKIDADLTAIAATINNEIIHPETETIGIVFPVYHGGLPLIVTRFVEKLASLENKYIYAVCTYGDSPGLAMEYLSGLVRSRGGQLAGGFGIHMPYNYITPTFNLKDFLGSFTLREINPEKQQILFADARKKINSISSFVINRQTGTLERDAVFISRLTDASPFDMIHWENPSGCELAVLPNQPVCHFARASSGWTVLFIPTNTAKDVEIASKFARSVILTWWTRNRFGTNIVNSVSPACNGVRRRLCSLAKTQPAGNAITIRM